MLSFLENACIVNSWQKYNETYRIMQFPLIIMKKEEIKITY